MHNHMSLLRKSAPEPRQVHRFIHRWNADRPPLSPGSALEDPKGMSALHRATLSCALLFGSACSTVSMELVSLPDGRIEGVVSTPTEPEPPKTVQVTANKLTID